MLLSWLITAALVVTFYFLYWLAKSNRNYWKKQGVTYVESPPLVGIMKDVILMRKGLNQVLEEIYQKYDELKFVGFFQFVTPTIMIRDPELVIQVLIKDFSHFEDRVQPISKPNDLLTMSIGHCSGDYWREVRNKLTPIFTSGKIKSMFGSMKECSDEFLYYIKDKTDQDLEARHLLSRYVINVIGNSAFGIKVDALNENDEKSKQFVKYSTMIFEPSISALLKICLLVLVPKLNDMFNLKSIDQRVETFFLELVKDIIKYREENNVKRNDFIQLMLEQKKNEQDILHRRLNSNDISFVEDEPIELEDKELLDNLKTILPEKKKSTKSVIFTDEFIASHTFIFISAGGENISATLTFVIYELARNQDLQKKVQEEISVVLSGQELTYELVKKMTYMEQFIYETLRMHPFGTTLFRICTKDYKIPGTEVIIKKGNGVQIPIVGLHKDPQYFPDPDVFDPDRFQEIDSITKGVFLPFGGGPRMCAAVKLVMLEMKIFMATLLSKYNITLSDKTNIPLKLLKNSLLATVDGGVWINFHKRAE